MATGLSTSEEKGDPNQLGEPLHENLTHLHVESEDHRETYGDARLEAQEARILAEAHKRRSAMSSEIFADWRMLNTILDKHEPQIHKRWLQKTKIKKEQILLQAWPDMPVSGRPDFEAIARRRRDDGTTIDKIRSSCMWPYINRQYLTKPKLLLVFIQSRARWSPDTYATTDEDAACLIRDKEQPIDRLPAGPYMMIFNNRKTADTYGEFVAMNNEELAWRGTTTGRGFRILEIQKRVMRFLVDCCKIILHDIPDHQLVSDGFPAQASISLRLVADGDSTSLTTMASEAPYRPPKTMDLDRLESLFASKLADTEDHIWQLREDPAYFSECILESQEHQIENIPDASGRQPLPVKPRDRLAFQHRVVANVVAMAYTEFEAWNLLVVRVRRLRELREKYAATISPEKALPSEYFDALSIFWYTLFMISKVPVSQLRAYTYASPNLRSYHIQKPFQHANGNIPVSAVGFAKLDQPQREVRTALSILLEQDLQATLFQFGLTAVVDILGHLVENERTARAMISPYIASIFSNLTIVVEGLRQMNRCDPWTRTLVRATSERVPEFQRAHERDTPYFQTLGELFQGEDGETAVKLAIPEGGRFYYPVAKRRTKENVDSMRAAEANLDAFWAAADRHMKNSSVGKIEGSPLLKLLAEPRSLHRTAAWVAPTVMQENENPATKVSFIEHPLSEFYFDQDRKAKSTTGRKILKNSDLTVKAKTKGVPKTPVAEEGRSGSVPTISPDAAPTISVDARAHKALITLFYTPNASDTPGEIKWLDFVHALVATGFAAEQMYGSVWVFRKVNDDVKTSILFHQPHGVHDEKVPYKKARNWGRRLERRFGWSAATFILKEKRSGCEGA